MTHKACVAVVKEQVRAKENKNASGWLPMC